MFACGTGSMRGPRVNTPLLLLLLLLLLTSLTGTVLCQDDVEETETEAHEDEAVVEEEVVDLDTTGNTEDPEILPTDDPNATPAPDPSPTGTDIENTNEEDHGSGLSRSLPIDDVLDPTMDTTGTGLTEEPGVEMDPAEDLNPLIIMIPVVLVVVIIAMIVIGIFISRRCKKKDRNQELGKEDPYLDGSSTEKVPMPMFEEDVPSVLELEMEELDQWMKTDGEPADDSKHA